MPSVLLHEAHHQTPPPFNAPSLNFFGFLDAVINQLDQSGVATVQYGTLTLSRKTKQHEDYTVAPGQQLSMVFFYF